MIFRLASAFVLLCFFISNRSFAETPKSPNKDKTESIEQKLESDANELKKLEKELKKLQKETKQNPPKINQALIQNGQSPSKDSKEESTREGSDDTKIIKLEEHVGENQKQKSRTQSEKDNQKSRSGKKSKQSTVEKTKQALKESEKKALDFIFPNINESSIEKDSTEKFFSKTEKEQLLELWRATLARNRSIQFIIRNLSSNPNEIEKNNAVLQVLSKALFVPFYAVSAVADNALISGGSAVGARVIGDVVDTRNAQQDHTKQVSRTDMVVLFMLVDEVAERLRRSYQSYKSARIEKSLVIHELEPARIDASEALSLKQNTSIFFTRMVVRDLERRLRQADLNYISSRRNLVELAGEEAVKSVDLLIDLEVEEMLSDILGI